MQRKALLILPLVTLLAVACALGSLILAEPQRTSDSAVTKVESALSKEKAKTVIVGNKRGEIIARFNTDDLREKGYKSLDHFVLRKASDECKKISTNCHKCPDGKIYCTNDAKFAAGKEDD